LTFKHELVLLAMNSVLKNQQHELNMVSLNTSTENKVMDGSVDETIVTTGTQGPNATFPLEAMVQYSLIQCS
jgi:hypothetical protein